MIDIAHEKLMSLNQVARLIPSTRRGRVTHTSTLLRWIRRGSRGRKLDAVRIGGNWFTSIEAVGRFAEPAPSDTPDAPRSRSDAARVARTEEALAQFGL